MDKLKLLKEIKTLLSDKFGNEIEKVILYGSRSKNISRSDSDYDILVILKHPHDWKIRRKISSACYDLDLKYDILTDIKTISLNELNTSRGKQPFIINALTEGLTV